MRKENIEFLFLFDNYRSSFEEKKKKRKRNGAAVEESKAVFLE